MNYVRVKNSNTLLCVDLELEAKRAKLYWPILVRHGKVYPHTKFDYHKYKALDPMDRCFDNAIQTAEEYGLTYVERLLIFNTEEGEVMLAHGWCADKDGAVVDPTCHSYQGKLEITYVGVPLDKGYVRDFKKVNGYYGCLDGDKNAGFEDYRQMVGLYVDPVSEWKAE